MRVDIDNSAVRYYSGNFFFFGDTSACNLVSVFVRVIVMKVIVCMRRRGQVELLPFDPEPERTLHQLRREQREAHQRDLAVMQNNEGQDQGQEQNEPQGGHNGNNGRNYAPKPFLQPDDLFMLIKEFALPPTVVQSAIQRPPIQANNFELKQ